MMRTIGHTRTAPFHGRSTRMLLALILALMSCVLVLPATASAKVDRKYAKRYAAKVAYYAAFQESHEDAYNGYLDTLTDTANEMKKVIGSPDPYDQAILGVLKANAQQDFDIYKKTLRPGNDNYLEVVQKFYPASKGWFSKPGDKLRFHRWTRRLAQGVMLGNAAWGQAALAFLALAAEDMAGAQEHNDEATKLATRANTYIQEAFEGLRALQR
jgi:hypothetical protein